MLDKQFNVLSIFLHTVAPVEQAEQRVQDQVPGHPRIHPLECGLKDFGLEERGQDCAAVRALEFLGGRLGSRRSPWRWASCCDDYIPITRLAKASKFRKSLRSQLFPHSTAPTPPCLRWVTSPSRGCGSASWRTHSSGERSLLPAPGVLLQEGLWPAGTLLGLTGCPVTSHFTALTALVSCGAVRSRWHPSGSKALALFGSGVLWRP